MTPSEKNAIISYRLERDETAVRDHLQEAGAFIQQIQDYILSLM